MVYESGPLHAYSESQASSYCTCFQTVDGSPLEGIKSEREFFGRWARPSGRWEGTGVLGPIRQCHCMRAGLAVDLDVIYAALRLGQHVLPKLEFLLCSISCSIIPSSLGYAIFCHYIQA